MRCRKPSGGRARRRYVGPAAAIALLLSALMGGPARSASPKQEAAPEEVRVVNILAERFFFVPSRFKVHPGEVVELRIRSADTNHGFRIRKAGINVVVPKRGKGEARVRFRADKKGSYAFECSKACGAGHNMMRGRIVVK